MVRAIDKGDLYIHQDANWNVIGTTDLAASIVERNVYTPYGQLTVNQETSYGDRDGDGDVDATDKGTPGTTCTGTVTGACRILDLDFDGDYDSTDATKFDALTQGIARHPGRTATATNQPFAHQGLLFEPELGSYQNRHRQYMPNKRRFSQRDRLGLSPNSGILIGGESHVPPQAIKPLRQYANGQSLYSYVRISPQVLTDPSGYGICDSGTSHPDCLPIHGRYCGPRYTAGCCDGCCCINPAPPPGPDPLDGCCEAHDGEYDNDGDNTDADANFCACLEQVPENQRGGDWSAVYGYFGC